MVAKFMLLGGVLPGLLATLALTAAWWRHSRPRANGAQAGPLWVAPIVISAAILPALLVVHRGLPEAWPASGSDRLAHAVLAVGLMGFIESLAGRQAWAAIVLRLIAMGAGLGIVLGPLAGNVWSATSGVAWIGGLAVALTLLASAADIAASRVRGPEVPIVLFAAASAAPVVLVGGGSAYLAQVCGGLAAALGAITVSAFIVSLLSIARGAASTAVGAVGVALAAGHFYGVPGLPPGWTLPLAAAPVLALVCAAPAVRRWAPWQRLVLAVALGGAPAAAVLAQAAPHASLDAHAAHAGEE